MELLGIFTAAFLLASARGVPTDCARNYQKLLGDITILKENCPTAAFHDCCQIKELVSPVNTGTFELEVCNATTITNSFTQTTTKHFARCDMETDGGKWMVIQRRINGSVDFYRNWTDYVNGFGDLEGEFWYGLEKIHCFTTRDDVELRIELGNGPKPSIVWTYQLFKVGGAETNYQLTIGQGHGVGGTFDAMANHNGRAFSTRDCDNDRGVRNCAALYRAGWWYNNCYHSNLNGKYVSHRSGVIHKLSWRVKGSRYINFTKVQMKIRTKRCSTCK